MPEEGDKQYQALRGEYSRLASGYDRRWKSYTERSIQRTLHRLGARPGDHILDVGCGTGVLLWTLSRSIPGVRLSGIDLSSPMLERARDRLGARAELRLGGAESLPFEEARFDLVTSTSVFHFIHQPVAALAEMWRVLKPSGRVVISDWCRDYFTIRLLDLFLRRFDRGHFRTYDSAEMHQLLVDADFHDVNVEPYRIDRLWGLMTAMAVKAPGTVRSNGRQTGSSSDEIRAH